MIIEKTMKIGFTGTRQGMTAAQRSAFKEILAKIDVDEFHHGDCIGADADAHHIIRDLFPGCTIISHPPVDNSQRAGCESDFARRPKPFLVRNHDIADEADILIGCPKEGHEIKRGTRGAGTWATIHYGRSLRMKVLVIWP